MSAHQTHQSAAGWLTTNPHPLVKVGQTAPKPPPAQDPNTPECFTLENVGAAVGKITPTLIVLWFASGVAFALGSGLIYHYVFSDHKRK